MGDVIDFAAMREARSRRAHPSAQSGPPSEPTSPAADPEVWCTTCRSQWFRLVPGLAPDGSAHDPAVCVTISGNVSAWTGALICADCGAGPFFLRVNPVGGIEPIPPLGPPPPPGAG